MKIKKISALPVAAAIALVLSSCGSATTDYMNTQWGVTTDKEKGLVCAFFRADPDEELGMGEESVARAAVETAAAEGIELDAKDVREFMDDECPSKAELDKKLEGEDSSEAAVEPEPEQEAPELATMEAGASHAYPDGLEVSVGNWRIKGEASADGSAPKPTVYLDVTATNPTDEPITTSQVWVMVRAGETGERLEEWAEGEPVDAILQPGASVTGEYVFTAPETPGHVIATVMWHEAEDPAMRYDTTFEVLDETQPAEKDETEGKSVARQLLENQWDPKYGEAVCQDWKASPDDINAAMAGTRESVVITEQDVAEFLQETC